MLLQKWGGEAGDQLASYPVFMATSQRSGKNNSGEYVYKKDALGNELDENGKPTTETGLPGAIDHDLDENVDAFVKWGKSQGFGFLMGDN